MGSIHTTFLTITKVTITITESETSHFTSFHIHIYDSSRKLQPGTVLSKTQLNSMSAKKFGVMCPSYFRISVMYDVTNFGYSHLAGNRSLGEQVTVKAVILELVKLLGTQ